MGDNPGSRDMKIRWEKPEPPGPGATVGERVEHSLAEGIRRFFDLFDDPLAELLSWPLRLVIKVVEKSTSEYTKPLLKYAIGSMTDDNPFKDLLTELLEPTGEGGLALLAGMGSQAGSAGLLSAFETFFEQMRQAGYESRPSKIFDLPTWVAMSFRELPEGVKLRNMSARLGYNSQWLPALKEAIRLRASALDLGAATQRGDLGVEEFKAELMARGMTSDDTDLAEKLLHIIPGPADLIRMAVREAFSEDIISQFDLDADLPDPFVEAAQKVGIDQEWARRYWISHWVLPSIQMGYEMLHRGVIGDEELDLLLRTQDIAPYWRPKLKEISYTPYTRVDIRRMYGMGILGQDAVMQSYLDRGYDQERAANMTAFTIRYAQDEERTATKTDIITALKEGDISDSEALAFLEEIGYSDLYAQVYVSKALSDMERAARLEEEREQRALAALERDETKGDILGAYSDRIYSRDEALTGLVEIGYPDTVAEVMLARVDFKKSQELARAEIATAHALFVSRAIDESGVHSRLGRLALPSEQLASLLELWTIERERRVKRPTKAELLRWYTKEIIDLATFTEEMKALGYSDLYIGWYLEELEQAMEEEPVE